MSTMHDMDRTALAPRGEDPTSAYAWASSPLGDPTSADLPHGGDFPPDPITRAAKAKSIDKVMVAAGLIGAIGAGVALGIAVFGSAPQPRSVAVASGSTGAPAAVPASAAPSPVPAASLPAPVIPPPDNGPAPVVALPENGPSPAGVVAPPPVNPPPPADPGTPPAAPPQGPVVMVNVPPPPAVWVPLPPPQLPPLPLLPPLPAPPKLPPLPAPPKLPPLPPPPSLCLPPHHLVQGVCK
jgi:hypothetical protein